MIAWRPMWHWAPPYIATTNIKYANLIKTGTSKQYKYQTLEEQASST